MRMKNVFLKLLVFVLILNFQAIGFCSLSEKDLQVGDYKITSTDQQQTWLISYKGKTIYEVKPKFLKPDETFDSVSIDLIYDHLADRHRHIKTQPKPFDDINGDGKPEVIFIEGKVRGQFWDYVVRVVSLDGENAKEYSPIQGTGEVLYFDDFNRDGILEFVTTDNERQWLYDRSGMPISRYVWICDLDYKSYYRATEMVAPKGKGHE